MIFTEAERRAVVGALMWMRQEVTLDHALDTGDDPVERAALTRAIKKLGGDPHPVRNLTAAAIAGARAGRADALARLEQQPTARRRVGFQP